MVIKRLSLPDQDFQSGSLRVTSYARPAKLFTANESLIAESIGVLNNKAMNDLIGAIITLFEER